VVVAFSLALILNTQKIKKYAYLLHHHPATYKVGGAGGAVAQRLQVWVPQRSRKGAAKVTQRLHMVEQSKVAQNS